MKHVLSQTIEGEIVEFNYADFNDLKNNKSYDRFYAGDLVLTTGKLVCADPIFRELALPQSWKVDPGGYKVYLYIGLKDYFAGRIAYAELVIKDEVPDKWAISLIPVELLKDSFERKINGMYPVENGLSCFSDYETFKFYNEDVEEFYKQYKNGNFYLDVLEKHFKENVSNPISSRGEDWAVYGPKKANGKIVMFGSGYGDGLYTRYVGYDKANNVVKFVTDFVQM